MGKAVSGEGVLSIWHGGIISQPVRTGQHPAMHLLIAIMLNVKIPFAIFAVKLCSTQQAFNSFHHTSFSSIHTIQCCPKSHLSKKVSKRNACYPKQKRTFRWIYGWVKGMGRARVGRGGCKRRGNFC